jgi:hypothetical protein
MECRDTIIPSAPTPFTALRALLGALWFQAGNVIRSTLRSLHRTMRRQRKVILSVAQDEPIPVSLDVSACNVEALRMLAGDTPLGEEKWLRLTEVVPRAR